MPASSLSATSSSWPAAARGHEVHVGVAAVLAHGRVEGQVPAAHALLHLADLGGLHVQLRAISSTLTMAPSPALYFSSSRRVRARLKNSFRCAWVVPSFTSDQDLRM